ncbi:MAG: geranylgeranyl diphosphate synthase type II [Gammaproteobacteria bacterium]|jgi:geranylgeranyl diphosphate synthase type II
MSFTSRLKSYQQRNHRVMDQWLPSDAVHPSRLHTAMRYAVLGPGKRVRPLLMYATAETIGLAAEKVDTAAAAVEMIHGYSLIHDDLPAMDDDDLRRGRPTCHKQFDEAVAILAGDALQAYAFEILGKDQQIGSAAAQVKMIVRLGEASGSLGMAGGQAIDLAAQGQKLDESQLREMHGKKTGALIWAAVMLAADAASNLPASQLEALDQYARDIGLAFQVQDDVLDVVSDTATLGKQQGADAALDKPTYVSVMGLEAAQQLASDLRDSAISALSVFGESAQPLRHMADMIVSRSH